MKRHQYKVSWNPPFSNSWVHSMEPTMKDALKVMHELFRDGFLEVKIKKEPCVEKK